LKLRKGKGIVMGSRRVDEEDIEALRVS